MSMVMVSIILLWLAAFTFKRCKLDRIEGVIFLLAYIAYITYLSMNI
jgi:cation:H+ antiporter